MTRKYELKKRAERQEETRRRIVEAAIQLHRTKGPGADDVQRHRRARGRPAAHALPPLPRRARAGARLLGSPLRAQPAARSGRVGGRSPIPASACASGLEALYAWYERNEDMFGCVLRDAEVDPLTRELFELRGGEPMGRIARRARERPGREQARRRPRSTSRSTSSRGGGWPARRAEAAEADAVIAPPRRQSDPAGLACARADHRREQRGARIFAPKGRDTRPTSDRVREAAFNLIGPVDGARRARPLRRLGRDGARGALARRGERASSSRATATPAGRSSGTSRSSALTGATVVCSGTCSRRSPPTARTLRPVLCDPPYGFAEPRAGSRPTSPRVLAPDGLRRLRDGARERAGARGAPRPHLAHVRLRTPYAVRAV